MSDADVLRAAVNQAIDSFADLNVQTRDVMATHITALVIDAVEVEVRKLGLKAPQGYQQEAEWRNTALRMVIEAISALRRGP